MGKFLHAMVVLCAIGGWSCLAIDKEPRPGGKESEELKEFFAAMRQAKETGVADLATSLAELRSEEFATREAAERRLVRSLWISTSDLEELGEGDAELRIRLRRIESRRESFVGELVGKVRNAGADGFVGELFELAELFPADKPS